jgi:NAD(P)H-dependent flavin oxidoreductase YrpB (nitropropane dioxygenase family)
MADTWNGERYQLRRFDVSALHKSAIGNIAAMANFAGESVGGVKKVQTAAEIIHELTSEAEILLRRWS